MPWIEQIPVEAARGRLKTEFDKALKRAGRVWHIAHIMSLNARTLAASMDMYAATMFGRSTVSRIEREMLAVVVSRANHCFY